MGIVIRQASYTTVFNYLGFLIGFINVTFLMNRLFTVEQFGIRSIIIDLAFVYLQFAQLGTYSSLIKFFPFVKNRNKSNDGGLLFLGLLISLSGYFIVGFIMLVFKDNITDYMGARSNVFEIYFYMIFPLSFFQLFSNVFENYLLAMKESIFSSFLRNVFNRLLDTILLVLFYYNFIDFYHFIMLYVLLFALNDIVFIIYLNRRKLLNFKIDWTIFNRRFRKLYYNYGFYIYLVGISGVLVHRIDAIMIGLMMDFTYNALYSNALYLTILISVPAVAIARIATPILSDQWKNKKMKEMEELYKNTALHQLLIGGVFFVLLWCNLDDIFLLQRAEYKQGKMVFLLLSIASLSNMFFGVNGQILNVTKLYRFNAVTSVLLALFTILSNYLLIPLFGINGAGFATMCSMILFNIIRYNYVKKKLGIHPFKMETIKVIFILIFAVLIGELLPSLDVFILSVLYKSIIILGVLLVIVVKSNVSVEINMILKKNYEKFISKKT